MEKFNFKPFDKVLVRDHKEHRWAISFFSNVSKEPRDSHPFVTINRCIWKYCIPYEGNEKLLDTTDPYVEHYVPEDGDFIKFGERALGIFHLLEKVNKTHRDYFTLVPSVSEVDSRVLSYTDYYDTDGWTTENLHQATKEERNFILSKLAEIGKKWNAEKKCIEDVWTPKDGDFVTYTYPGGHKYVAIYYCKESDSIDCFYVDICLKNEIEYFVNKTNYKNRFERNYAERRPATDSEKQQLLDALHKKGKDWDAEKKEIVEYKWKPKDGEDYWIINSEGIAEKIRWIDDYRRDNNRYELGNCFRMKAEAQAMADKFKELLKGGK